MNSPRNYFTFQALLILAFHLCILSTNISASSNVFIDNGSNLIVGSSSIVTLSDNGQVQVLAGGHSQISSGATVDGNVTVNTSGTLDLCGVINGSLTNSGTVFSQCDDNNVNINGNLNNTGSYRLTQNTSLNIAGNLVNSGLLDVVTSMGLNVAGAFTNTGILWDNDQASHQTQIAINGDDAEISITTYSPHFYQLQSRDDLSKSSWGSIGARRKGPNIGNVELLQFVDIGVILSKNKKFYRLLISDE